MAQLKPVTTGGLLKDVNDNFAALAPVGLFDGLSQRRTAVCTFDAGGEGNPNQAVGAHAAGWKVPANAIVVGGVVDVVQAFTGEEGATLAVSIAQANDIVAAAAVGGVPWSTTGLKAIVPKANTPEATGIKLTAAKAITFTVGTAALTAGRVVVYLDYYEGVETESGE